MSTPTPLRSTQSSLSGTYTTPRTLTGTYAASSGWTPRSYASTSQPRSFETSQTSPEHSKQFQSQIEDEIRQLSDDIDRAENDQATQLEKITKQLNEINETLKQQKGSNRFPSFFIYLYYFVSPLQFYYVNYKKRKTRTLQQRKVFSSGILKQKSRLENNH